MKKIIFSVIISIFCYHLYSQDLQEITGFGTNQGNLKMYVHVPTNLQTSAPIVVALHGCTQSAIDCSNTTGWNELSDKYGFIVLYPEQQYANNSSYCFNWFLPADQERNSGEPASIIEMIEHLKTNYTIDSTKIYVTGLSAGAGMSNVLLACYPDVFSAGAIMAGTPYKSGTDITTAYYAMNGLIDKSATEWGNIVRNAYSTYDGNYPKVSVFHGLSDNTVKPQNINEIIEQWTNVHATDAVADEANSNFFDNLYTEQTIFSKNTDTIMVVYKISIMGHGISVDTGTCSYQGGTAEIYSYNMRFHSTYWAARFFELIPLLSINGNSFVNESETNLTYSVNNVSSSTFEWIFPAGVQIVSGQGTKSLVVNWGSSSGYISVVETDSEACTNPPIYKKVSIGTSVDAQTLDNDFKIIYSKNDKTFLLKSFSTDDTYYKIVSIDGRILNEGTFRNETKLNIHQAEGIVIVNIVNDKKAISKKIIL